MPVDGALPLSAAQSFSEVLAKVVSSGRRQLYEHEVYRLLAAAGIDSPKHVILPRGSSIQDCRELPLEGSRVVVKWVSESIVHKSDFGAVRVVDNAPCAISSCIANMERELKDPGSVGVLLVEFVEHDNGIGGELLVGIRSTRDFGPVIVAGLGGVDTEFVNAQFDSDAATALAVVQDSDPASFLENFKRTAAYALISGGVRGHERSVSDEELLRCFAAIFEIAHECCSRPTNLEWVIDDFEVNPFAVVLGRMIPLDGVARLSPFFDSTEPRPVAKVDVLLQPRSIALVGVSSKPDSLGRFVLKSITRAGFLPSRLTVVKPGTKELDGVRCAKSITELPATDLLVVTAPSASLPGIIDEANASKNIQAAILISGGAGETATSADLGAEIRSAIIRGRENGKDGMVVLGPNCMGVRSLIGDFDTFFVPEDKLNDENEVEPQPLAIVSQSGAFIVSRQSSLPQLNPAISVSIGNQSDVTLADVLGALNRRDDILVAGAYLEGFADMDGTRVLKEVREWTGKGRTVVFYKAARTQQGRAAAVGHTASVAGDYAICASALRNAGAIVSESFREFGQLLETATALCDRKASGGRIFVLTNAGMEAVAMADCLDGRKGGTHLCSLSGDLKNQLIATLSKHGLGELVSANNPLDLTPMADERVYDEIVNLAVSADEVDAVLVSCVPLAPQLKTLEQDLHDPSSFVQLAKEWRAATHKPIVFVIDAGEKYDALAKAIRCERIPVFRSADEAASCFKKWLDLQP